MPPAWCSAGAPPQLWVSGVAVSRPSTASARFHDFALLWGAKKPLSTLNIKLDVEGAGPCCLLGRGNRSRALMRGCSQQGGCDPALPSTAGSLLPLAPDPAVLGSKRSCHSGFWIHDSHLHGRRSSLLKVSRRQGRVKNTASHSSRIPSCFFNLPVSPLVASVLELGSNSPVPNPQKH